jgi:hypothetical protein
VAAWHYLFQRTHDRIGIGREPRVTQFERVPTGEWLQIVWQLVFRRHHGTIDQNWNHWDIALECQRQFDADIVTSAVKSAMASLIAGVEPARANHGDDCVTLRNLNFELLGEVDAGCMASTSMNSSLCEYLNAR